MEQLRAAHRLPALLAPVPNLSGGRVQRLLAPGQGADGLLDVTQPPFRADNSGATDTTAALQRAIWYARAHYLVVYLPAGRYLVSDTLLGLQTERLDAIDGTNGYWQQARYVPVALVGSTGNRTARSTIVLAPGTFTNASSPQPVVWLWMQNHQGGSQPNANCNQKLESVDIVIGANNPGAMGVRVRGAQGTVVRDVTIYAGDGLVGLSGGSGSGGAHFDVTVIGGRFGADLTQTQPGPVLTGITLVNQTCSALVMAGLQTLTAVGLDITVG